MGSPIQAEKEAIKRVIKESNAHEMALYKNPPDDELFKKFKATVKPGGARDLDVSGRVERAREAGRKALNVTHQIEVVFIKIEENSAVVDTKETGGFEWSDNASPPFRQNRRHHRYWLVKVRVKDAQEWVIDREVMDPQQ
jgi:hypothetical protein